MPSRLVLLTLVAVAAAHPCFAQTVVSRHPPLSPDDAVRVLRSSHSLSDMANRPIVDEDGPHIYVIPYDRSTDVPPVNPPIEPLSRDQMPFPYGYGYGYGGGFDGGFPYAPFTGMPFNGFRPFNGFASFNGFAPFNNVMGRPRVHANGLPPVGVPRAFPPRPAPRFNVIGAAPAGLPLTPR
jgi:hypothetical protein